MKAPAGRELWLPGVIQERNCSRERARRRQSDAGSQQGCADPGRRDAVEARRAGGGGGRGQREPGGLEAAGLGPGPGRAAERGSAGPGGAGRAQGRRSRSRGGRSAEPVRGPGPAHYSAAEAGGGGR